MHNHFRIARDNKKSVGHLTAREMSVAKKKTLGVRSSIAQFVYEYFKQETSQTDLFATRQHSKRWRNKMQKYDHETTLHSYQITQEHSQYMHRLYEEARCKRQGQNNVKTKICTVNWKPGGNYRGCKFKVSYRNGDCRFAFSETLLATTEFKLYAM